MSKETSLERETDLQDFTIIVHTVGEALIRLSKVDGRKLQRSELEMAEARFKDAARLCREQIRAQNIKSDSYKDPKIRLPGYYWAKYGTDDASIMEWSEDKVWIYPISEKHITTLSDTVVTPVSDRLIPPPIIKE